MNIIDGNIDGRRVKDIEDVPTTPHLQVFTYEAVHADDGWGGSSRVSYPVIHVFTLQCDAERWIEAYKLKHHGDPIWCQRSTGRATIETKTTIKIGNL